MKLKPYGVFLLLTFISALPAISFAKSTIVKAKSLRGQEIDAVSSNVLVKYKSGKRNLAHARMAQSFGISSKPRLQKLDIEVVHVPENQSVNSFIEQLKKDPDVEFVEPNGIYHATASPNDPSYSSQYYLDANFLNIEQAWTITQGSPTVVVAVIDSGILLTHSDLSANLWVNPNVTSVSGLHGAAMEILWNSNGTCNDFDSFYGPEQCEGPDPTDNKTLPVNEFKYHGTHVAGIIAAVSNNATDISGIAPNCRLMAVKALNASGSGTDESIANGIIYAVDNGASVINMSLGGPSGSATMENAVNYALNHNVVVVAASGNEDGRPVDYPAAFKGVIAVSATDSHDLLASYSNIGPEITLSAPGSGIVSTNIGGTTSGDGTSFASPMVAAVAALIRSLSPSMSVAEVTRYLAYFSDDKGPSGFDTSYGFGRLNAYKSVSAVRNNSNFIANPATPGETFPYPNPYNPKSGTLLNFSIPASLGSQNIKIDIMNLLGETVKTISGTNTWDGRNEDGNFVASGLYIYRVQTSTGNAKGKITILK